ncbi:T9SS type A sorting domain-containing protein [Flavobacterium sp.]|uniref:T9SS type A sorting domain-containing protein n=1 Tax=Flavobacterium sp. TaxID=239 RepID=UPI0026124AD4|nr:T9SS type A sorting domain-containing protein [Flavobacterium sp.]
MQKLIIISVLSLTGVQAQQSVNSSGGNGSGIGGSFSYTVGQIDYVAATGTNGSLSQGVQQPFEIFTLGNNDYPTIQLQAIVYPNPTTENVNLSISNHSLENLEYDLYDVTGKLISHQKITANETQISIENLSVGNYFIAVNENNKKLKTFKIIKN